MQAYFYGNLTKFCKSVANYIILNKSSTTFHQLTNNVHLAADVSSSMMMETIRHAHSQSPVIGQRFIAIYLPAWGLAIHAKHIHSTNQQHRLSRVHWLLVVMRALIC